jgi:hypothetical protein
MGSIYDDYIHESVELQHHVEDVIDDHGHPQAHALMNEMRQLTAAFKEEKNPHHMEDQLKVMENSVENMKHQGQAVLSYQDAENLQHRFRRMRENIRSMPGH